jgi:hypothetical protein
VWLLLCEALVVFGGVAAAVAAGTLLLAFMSVVVGPDPTGCGWVLTLLLSLLIFPYLNY